MSVPILSFNAPTSNVLLKITVPKRIGRKRKRGDLDPTLYAGQEFSPLPENGDDAAPADGIRSQSRKDHPTELLRTLKDNVGNYSIEPVAEITNTHRFRGKNLCVGNLSIANDLQAFLTFITRPSTPISCPGSEIRYLRAVVSFTHSWKYF